MRDDERPANMYQTLHRRNPGDSFGTPRKACNRLE
jgi:hypothetical protein